MPIPLGLPERILRPIVFVRNWIRQRGTRRWAWVPKEIGMSTILIIVLVILLLGGFGGYHGYNRYGGPGLGGVLGLVLIVFLVLWLVGGVQI
jgi:uncharacterized protein DUF3309